MLAGVPVVDIEAMWRSATPVPVKASICRVSGARSHLRIRRAAFPRIDAPASLVGIDETPLSVRPSTLLSEPGDAGYQRAVIAQTSLARAGAAPRYRAHPPGERVRVQYRSGFFALVVRALGGVTDEPTARRNLLALFGVPSPVPSLRQVKRTDA